MSVSQALVTMHTVETGMRPSSHLCGHNMTPFHVVAATISCYHTLLMSNLPLSTEQQAAAANGNQHMVVGTLGGVLPNLMPHKGDKGFSCAWGRLVVLAGCCVCTAL